MKEVTTVPIPVELNDLSGTANYLKTVSDVGRPIVKYILEKHLSECGEALQHFQRSRFEEAGDALSRYYRKTEGETMEALETAPWGSTVDSAKSLHLKALILYRLAGCLRHLASGQSRKASSTKVLH